jgi:RPA family protein
MAETYQKRNVAIKCSAEEINNSKFIREEGMLPNYIMLKGNKISRINIIGTLIEKEEGQQNIRLKIDDGTGSVILVLFERLPDLEIIEIGMVLLVIGKPRQYGEEKYIMPEAIKPIDKDWLKYRKIELMLNPKNELEIENISNKNSNTEKELDEIKIDDELIVDSIKEEDLSPTELIFERIKELDNDDGVSREDILSKIKIKEADSILLGLLERGEIYEIRPGKYKLL